MTGSLLFFLNKKLGVLFYLLCTLVNSSFFAFYFVFTDIPNLIQLELLGLLFLNVFFSRHLYVMFVLFPDGFVQFENCCLKYDYSQQKQEHASKHIHRTHFALHN